jgi:hypothetical protein
VGKFGDAFYKIGNHEGSFLHRTNIKRRSDMKMLNSSLLLSFAGLLILICSSCGATTPSNPRLLTAITLSPATADAQSFPTGQVQFSAVAHYNAAPTTVNPFSPTSWLSTDGNIATVDQSGLAQCVSGAVGTVQIQGIAPKSGPGSGAMAPAVRGTATLTCP